MTNQNHFTLSFPLKSPADAKAALVARVWSSGAVPQMLARAGSISTRPDGESPSLGLVSGGYRLTEIQAQAILDMRLHRLTGLEQEKIIKEFEELLTLIRDLSDILARPERLLEVIRNELEAIRDSFSDKRRTEIISTHEDLTIEDLISPEEVVVTLSHGGYAKAQPVSDYQAQRRGGAGQAANLRRSGALRGGHGLRGFCNDRRHIGRRYDRRRPDGQRA